MAKEKKMPQQPKKEIPSPKRKSIDQFLKNIEENEMIDDHGPVILGGRERKPRLPDED